MERSTWPCHEHGTTVFGVLVFYPQFLMVLSKLWLMQNYHVYKVISCWQVSQTILIFMVKTEVPYANTHNFLPTIFQGNAILQNIMVELGRGNLLLSVPANVLQMFQLMISAFHTSVSNLFIHLQLHSVVVIIFSLYCHHIVIILSSLGIAVTLRIKCEFQMITSTG